LKLAHPKDLKKYIKNYFKKKKTKKFQNFLERGANRVPKHSFRQCWKHGFPKKIIFLYF
jgi:hypothetical protein